MQTNWMKTMSNHTSNQGGSFNWEVLLFPMAKVPTQKTASKCIDVDVLCHSSSALKPNFPSDSNAKAWLI